MNTKNPKNTFNNLKALGEIIKTSPKGSKRYKDAMKELDEILGIPEDLDMEEDSEQKEQND